MPRTKKIYLEGFLLLIAILLMAAAYRFPAKNIEKRYLPNSETPYWFETKSDLLFSEEIHLPDYNEKELGKLEYPSLAIDSHKNVFVAYDFTSENGKESIFLNSFQDADLPLEEIVQKSAPTHFLKFKRKPEWQSPLQVSTAAGSEYRPRLAVTREDVVWIVWSAKRQGEWDIYARTFSSGELGDEIQVTKNTVHDFRPVVLADASGKVWIAWERGNSEKNMQIVVKYFQHGLWSDEFILEKRSGYAYRPALLEAPSGTVWLAWDFTSGHNSDIYLQRYNDGAWLPEPVRVSSHPAIDSKAALAWHDKKLWVSWSTNRRGEDDWGIIRYPIVRAFDGQSWFEPVAEMNGIDLLSRSETQSYEYPTMTFDAFGRLYLFNRHDHVFSGAFYENGSWSSNWLLDESGWGLRGLQVHFAWLSQNELWLARRDRKSIFLQKMVRQNPKKQKLRLNRYVQKNYPEQLKSVAGSSRRGPTKHGDYKVYYGDLHVHTAYSDGSGSFDELYNLYRNIYKVDFLAITEHDALRLGNNHFSPGEWAYLKALNEIYNQPGEFVTINAYEWTHSTWSGRQDSSVAIGHKNVYFKGGEGSPFFNHHDKVAHDGISLFKALHKAEGLAFPHHPPWSGMNWQTHDPEIQSNYEIVSIHGANEHPGNLPIPHRGGLPATFAQDGLALGKRFGFVGASDSHGLYFHSNEGWREDAYKGGLTGVLLSDTLSRKNVWLALKARRNYATAGEKHYLEFFINGAPMGSEIEIKQPPVISFEVRSHKLLYAYILRDNQHLFVSGKIGGNYTAYKNMKDTTVQPGSHFYYLRAVYTDGTAAWSSPIWVNYLNEEEIE